MSLFTVLAYLFLIMASGIQSGFKKVFESEMSPLYMLAPRYYYTWIRSLPMISGVIVGFYPLYLISPFQFHWGVLLCLHLILVVFLGAILQVIYMNAIGYSPNSGKHVFGIMFVGYLMIVIGLIFDGSSYSGKNEDRSAIELNRQSSHESIKESDGGDIAPEEGPIYNEIDYSESQDFEIEYQNKDTAGMSALEKSKMPLTAEEIKKYSRY